MTKATLNNVYDLMGEVLRANKTADIDKKMLALNEGYKYLLGRMIVKGSGPGELLSDPTNLASVVNINKVSLPTDYFMLDELYVKSGTDYLLFGDNSIVDYATLRKITGTRFLDTTDIGLPLTAAVSEPYIYFEQHFDVSQADKLKIIYFKLPETLVAYDRLTVEDVTGTFTVGETITGGDPEVTATVYATDNETYVDVLTESRNALEFALDVTVTGQLSGATAKYKSMAEKPQNFELSDKYRFLLANAAATTFLYMRDELELNAKNATMEALIDDFNVVNVAEASYQLGMEQ